LTRLAKAINHVHQQLNQVQKSLNSIKKINSELAESVKSHHLEIKELILSTLEKGGLNAVADLKLTKDHKLFELVKESIRDELFRRSCRIFTDAKSRVLVLCKKIVVGLEAFSVDDTERAEALISGSVL
jgi:hypothetical protein